MPRARTGTVFHSRGRWFAQLWVGDKREAFALPTCDTKAAASKRLAVLRELVATLAGQPADFVTKLLGETAKAPDSELAEARAFARKVAAGKVAVQPGPGSPIGKETVQSLGERWTSGELARLYPDHVRVKRAAEHDASRLKLYVYPLLPSVTVEAFTIEHAELVMRSLPKALRPATRRQVAQLLSRLLNLAVYPLRLRAASPLPRGWLPRVGTQARGEILFPDEEARFLACAEVNGKPDEGVPFAFRFLVGFLAREGMRASEAAMLTWGDVDLEHGTVNLDRNKTDDPRSWALAADVRRVLEHVKRGRKPKPGDRVFLGPDGEPLGRVYDGSARLMYGAEDLRAHLKLAKVDRARLFTDGPAHIPTRLHDLRGLFVTSALATGRSEAWVSERTGHKSSAMIARYRRRASTWQQAKHGALIALDAGLGIASGKASAPRGRGGGGAAKPHETSQFGRVDSNHDSGIQRAFVGGPTGSDPPLSPVDPIQPDDALLLNETAACDSAGVSDLNKDALEVALERASAAGRWDVVALLAEELRARRLDAAGVVELDAAKRTRGGS
jgi:integrase